MLTSIPDNIDTGDEKQRLVRGSFYNWFSWAANVITNLALVPFMVYYLGIEGYGIFAILSGLVGYFALLDLGLGQGVIRYVAYHASEKKWELVSPSINTALILQAITGGLGMFMIWIFNRPILELFKVSPDFIEEASAALRWSSIGFFLAMLMNGISSALMGLQRFDLIAKANLGFSLVGAVSTISILALGGGLLQVVIVGVLIAFSNLVVFVFLLRHACPQYRFSLSVGVDTIRQLFSFSSYMALFQVTNVLNNYFVRFAVGAFWGPTAVTYYAVPAKVVTAIQAALGSIVNVLFPFVSHQSAKASSHQLSDIYQKAIRYVLTVSAPIFLFLVLYSRPLLNMWMGAEFAENTWVVLIILGFAYGLSTQTMVPANFLFGLGRSKLAALFSMGVALLSITFVITFASMWSAKGASVGILLTQLPAPVFVWYVTRHVLGISSKQALQQLAILPWSLLGIYVALNLIALPVWTFVLPTSNLVPVTYGCASLVVLFGLLVHRRFLPAGIFRMR